MSSPRSGPTRDLQAEWEPSTFRWGVVIHRRHGIGECWCVGSTTPEQRAAGLCNCQWEGRYGIPTWERMLVR